MAKLSHQRSIENSRFRLNPKLFKTTDVSLVVARMKELDREFARQTKQLTSLTKGLGRKVSKRLLPPTEK